jgi:hypothetical protein
LAPAHSAIFHRINELQRAPSNLLAPANTRSRHGLSGPILDRSLEFFPDQYLGRARQATPLRWHGA